MAKNGAISMTGYGSAHAQKYGVRVDVEIRTVNARYFDCICKIPDEYASIQQALVEQTQKSLSRGRVELSITRSADAELGSITTLDVRLFDQLVDSCRKAAERIGIHEKQEVNELVRAAIPSLLARKEVLSVGASRKVSRQELMLVPSVVRVALDKTCRMRQLEGRRLSTDIEKRLRALKLLQVHVHSAVKDSPGKLRARLLSRLAQLDAKVQADPSRIAQEVLLLADRIDISEELVRFESHLEAARETLKASESGKKLDFLVQEMLRECNTIASKCQDAAVQHFMVDAKSEIERIREQAQNLA